MTDIAGRLAEFAKERPTVVCLPDFFVDHFVELPTLSRTLSQIRRVHARGGGGWVGLPQRYLPGGNAGNAARALAALGAESRLIARTDAFGAAFARATLGEEGVDVSRVRGDGRIGTTTALEFQPGPRNVMLNEPGSVDAFGPDDLEPEDRRLIESADAVLIGNWAQSRRHGTELAETVLARKRGLAFIDTSDASGRKREAPEFVRRVLASPRLDVVGLNENELRIFGGAGPPMAVGTRLAKRLSATLDVHTESFAATWEDGHATQVKSFDVPRRRATGAGDSWNAGDLAGHLLGLEPEERLRLAHACAALYLSSDDGVPPGGKDVAAFLRRRAR